MHGDRGASNSEAREKFGAQQIVGAAKEIDWFGKRLD